MWNAYRMDVYTLHTDTRLSALIEGTMNDPIHDSLNVWNYVLDNHMYL